MVAAITFDKGDLNLSIAFATEYLESETLNNPLHTQLRALQLDAPLLARRSNSQASLRAKAAG